MQGSTFRPLGLDRGAPATWCWMQVTRTAARLQEALRQGRGRQPCTHHAVLDLAKLVEVRPEVLIAHLSLSGHLSQDGAGQRDAGRGSCNSAARWPFRDAEQGKRTVPPTNIFLVRPGVLLLFLGTAAFASTRLPSMTCSRCCDSIQCYCKTCRDTSPVVDEQD